MNSGDARYLIVLLTAVIGAVYFYFNIQAFYPIMIFVGGGIFVWWLVDLIKGRSPRSASVVNCKKKYGNFSDDWSSRSTNLGGGLIVSTVRLGGSVFETRVVGWHDTEWSHSRTEAMMVHRNMVRSVPQTAH